jgi:hypothetical protein
MEYRGDHQPLEKPVMLQQIGCSLVVVALVLLLVITTSSALYSPVVLAYSYILLALGIALAIGNRIAQAVFAARLRRQRVICRTCGWSGNGEVWYRSECCPECDGEDVVMIG